MRVSAIGRQGGARRERLGSRGHFVAPKNSKTKTDSGKERECFVAHGAQRASTKPENNSKWNHRASGL